MRPEAHRHRRPYLWQAVQATEDKVTYFVWFAAIQVLESTMVFWPVMDALGFSNEVFAGGWFTDVKLERGCAWLIRPIGINAKPAGRNFFVNQALRKFICAIVLNKVFFPFLPTFFHGYLMIFQSKAH